MPSVLPIFQRYSQPSSGNVRSVTYQSPAVAGNFNQNVTRRVLHNNTKSKLNSQQNDEQQMFCTKCTEGHKLSSCRQFKSLSIPSRWEFVKESRLCFSCLQRGHSLMECRSKRECGIDECRRMHHQLLHQSAAKAIKTMPPVTSTSTSSSTEVASTSITQNRREHLLNCHKNLNTCLFKILPVVVSGPRTTTTVYAMFDEGSSVTLLEEDVAEQLGVNGLAVPLTLQWYNQKETTEESRVINLEVKRVNECTTYQLKNVYTARNLDLPKQSFDKGRYNHLSHLPIESYADIKPCLLIGLDHSMLSVAKQTIYAGSSEPIAAATKLGWVAYGPTQYNVNPIINVLHMRKTYDIKLHQLVKEYFELDSLGIKNTSTLFESTEDSRARKILEDTVKNIGERYEVGLLWKEDNIHLPPSYEMAKRRLLNVEQKMRSDERYADNYRKEMCKYINKGYVQLLTPEEAERNSPSTWYLPHFGVINPNKPQKLRIVFDAAAAVTAVSLNSVLLKGPERAQPLMTIMYKFRQRRIAVAGDIQEMFSQIKIRASDRNSQRFLWRHSYQSNQIQVYTMTSMIFGAACSPCCAEHIKNINATRFEATMPKGVKAITDNTYVDDLVISFDNVEEANLVVKEAIAINTAAGFHLRNFVSNHKELQNQLNNNAATPSDVINMEHQPKTDKILGMFWNSKDDVLEFHFKFAKIPRAVLDGKRPPTKRELLGLAMAIYDPFGLLANVTIDVKILLQATWKLQIEWDDVLPHQLATQWSKWWSGFQKVSHIVVLRCFSPLYSTAQELQFHVFVDASDTAYAAVAYLRMKQGNNIDVAFVAAKSRCAPKKETTVPRLELQAAVLGSRLKIAVEKCLDRKVSSTTFWSDSKTVLLWIRSTKRDYKQFVANRIAELFSSTLPKQWRWVPSAVNIADEATKIKPSQMLENDSRWIKGPAFLFANESEWPKEPTQMYSLHSAVEECTKKCLLIANNRSLIDMKRYSTFTKLVRVIAWILRFVNNLKLKQRYKGELIPKELIAAENYICRQVQYELYKIEINALQNQKELPKSSQLIQLTPKLDDQGVLRINGRIDAAYCLPDSARHPIILPHNHNIALLVMDHYHRKNHHQNSKLTINEMRQRFWIPNCHSLLNTVKRNCPVCIRDKSTPAVPLMGQLPPDRLTPYVRPFTYTGTDYCGPFFVTIGRRREKRWIALFTCLTTRAIHLEISTDLSTDAFLLCLKNFVNRRGVPVRIRSDNGTNFIGAQSKLKKQERLLDFDAIQQETGKTGVEWNFNSPANPSAGGCWERLVQCTKRILHRVLKEEAPRLDTFCSVLIEAENIINSRPLTDIPLTAESPEPITPNHFLLGCLNSTQTPCEDEKKICLRKQCRIAQNLKNRFWKRWINEYLPQLLKRPKWHKEVKPLQSGQLVIICDSSLPRSQWKMGRILDVITAKDGQVRNANVRTSHGIIRRPAAKLAALEFVNPPQDSPGGGMLVSHE
ncbi:uncharacterized protein LOC119676179 [Teleopsis dalmanni]|uniref:uncharacterized protein LOC119676179 n=1 Tax=Teleopsis dalmanni TaxID=139649 RepID=UPI0018CD22DC|nr:uncharacterized protein LOC119676179 [Teleopsis dalmanni]